MNEIKYRAWDVQNKRMVVLIDTKEGIIDTKALVHLNDDFFIPMQYTGFKDKNGVEIYEGDILNTLANGDKFPDITRNQTVVSDPECPGSLIFYPVTGASLCKKNQNTFEVIGNIHENPELSENE